ncbi:hypothetical protein C1646_769973 [Rhizophagus diaphanus]|nr:hypothetical protein C1646_769973 [Rhizophagus diaphanus] [Rhizophagus sp. MUCL 43196]
MNYHLNITYKVYEKKKAEQLKIDGEFKKVTPYKEPKQQELNKVNGNEFILFARLKNPKGKYSAIFETCFIMQDIAVDLAFILLKVKNTPHLIISTIIFFILPINSIVH